MYTKLTNDEMQNLSGGTPILWFVAITAALKFLTDTAISSYKMLSSNSGEVKNGDIFGGGSSSWEEANQNKVSNNNPMIYAY